MENFRKKRPGQTRKDLSPIDGFVRRTAAPGEDSFKPQQPAPSRVVQINDFKRPEGFMPRQRSVNPKIPDGTSLGRKPSSTKEETVTIPKKAKKHSKKSRESRGVLRRAFSGMFALGLLAAGFVVGFAFLRASQVFTGGQSALALECNVAPEQLTGEGDGRVNIMLLGKGGAGHTAPDLTDTIIVASVDTCQKEAGLVSIPRDLYVQVPGNGSMKINSVYATYKQQALAEGKSKKQAEEAGIDAIERTTEQVLGMPINYYALVDFEAFRKAIDTVGGITVNADEPLFDATVAWENNGSSQLAVKGENHFNGKQALLYARSRHGSARGDFDRGERQRQIIVALRDKVFTLGTFGNPVKMTQLLNAFGSHVQTNLGIEDLTKLYEIGAEVDGSKVSSLGLSDPPHNFVTTANYGGLSVVVPRAGVNQYQDIHVYIRTSLRDGFIKKEDPKILVLNGTVTTGEATKHKDVLESYGYSVIGVGDAPTKDYGSTTFVDLTGNKKRYTKRYLQLRYKTTATDDLPAGIDPGLADFVIIVGRQ